MAAPRSVELNQRERARAGAALPQGRAEVIGCQGEDVVWCGLPVRVELRRHGVDDGLGTVGGALEVVRLTLAEEHERGERLDVEAGGQAGVQRRVHLGERLAAVVGGDNLCGLCVDGGELLAVAAPWGVELHERNRVLR